MKVGEGAGKWLGDWHNGESLEKMRERWKAGEYGPPGNRPSAKMIRQWIAFGR